MWPEINRFKTSSLISSLIRSARKIWVFSEAMAHRVGLGSGISVQGSVLIAFPAKVQIAHRQQRRTDNKQKGDGIDDRCAAVAHLQIEIDG